jgi:hypothetical protein
VTPISTRDITEPFASCLASGYPAGRYAKRAACLTWSIRWERL